MKRLSLLVVQRLPIRRRSCIALPIFGSELQVSSHVGRRRNLSTQHARIMAAVGGPPKAPSHNNNNNNNNKPTKMKPWLDATVPLNERIQEFLKSHTVHKADLHANEMRLLLADCCKQGTLEGMDQAHSILERLFVEKRKHQKNDPTSEYSVDQSFVSTVLYGWVHLAFKLRVAMVRMRELLDLAIDEAKHDVKVNPSVNKFGMVTVQTYNTYLRGLSNAAMKNPQAAVAAEVTLYEMDDLHRSLRWHTKPNTRTYSLVITAFARTNHRNAGDRALNILRRMQQQYVADVAAYQEKFGTPYVPPTVTDQWEEQQEHDDDDDDDNDDGDESSGTTTATVNNNKHVIAKPDAAIYTSCMQAMLEHNPDRAISLLQEAIEERIPLDSGVFVLPINALAKKIEWEKNAKSRIDIAGTAERMLGHMIEQWTNGRIVFNPKDELLNHTDNSIEVGYNACLDVWSRAFVREGPLRCEALLHTMIDASNGVPPTAVSFNSCYYAWSKANKFYPDAPTRAMELLALQWEVAKEFPAAKPDFQSYTICINVVGKSDEEDNMKLKLSLDLLEELVNKVAQREMEVTRNPTAPFTAVMSTIARMKPMLPSDKGYEEAIDTKSDPFAVATEVYQQIKDDASGIGTGVDHHAIGAYLRCIAAHCPIGSTDRHASAKMVFEEACELGLVAKTVVDGMHMVFRDELTNVVPELKAKNFPRLWSRNITDTKFR